MRLRQSHNVQPNNCFSFPAQLVPLLLVTDHDSGGYNMDDSEIGIVLMSVAVIQLLWLVITHFKIILTNQGLILLLFFRRGKSDMLIPVF